ncbi:MAG: FHA domain-containing protein [Chthonomonadales bacterium]|nr:FHA domain-containing protein [Chthonomonadales bacterium]
MLYRWAQSGGLAATLRRAGIEVSGPQPTSEPAAPWEPNAAPAPIVADPSLCPFCGQRKDGGGNCACTLGSAVDATLAPAAAGQPRLVATVGAYAGGIFPIDPTGATVGRDTANQIALPDDTTVSRRHAAIRPENGAFTVTDEGSSNGVFVNGVRIDHARPLRPGDEVQIGATRFRFDW